MNILLVEDDKGIARFVRKGLLEHGFSVDLASDGEAGLNLALQRRHDLIILDILLPKMDGFKILTGVRAASMQTPVIVLTARDSEEDIVRGLNAGADDYLTKPFSFNELLARVHALLRRGGGGNPPSKLRLADLTLEVDGHRVFRGEEKIDLTPKEYALLEFFMRHPGEIITRTMINEKVWDYHFDTSTNIVEVHMSHLRNKIDKNFKTRLLHTVKGVGYVMEERD